MAISLQNLSEQDKQFLQQQKAQGVDAQTAFTNLSESKKKDSSGGIFSTIFGGVKNTIKDTANAFQEGVENTEEQRQQIMELQKSGQISNPKAFSLYAMNTLNKMIQPTSQAAFEATVGTTGKILDNTAGKLVPFLTKLIGAKNIDAFQKKVFDTPIMNTDPLSDPFNTKTKELVSLNEKFNELVQKYDQLPPETKVTVDNILTTVDSVGSLFGAFQGGKLVGKTGQLTSQAVKDSLINLKNINPKTKVTEGFDALKGAVNKKVTGMFPNTKTPTSIAGLNIRPAENLAEAATELGKKGFEQPFVDFLEKAAPADQDAFRKMLGLAEKNKGEFKVTTRPIEVPGENLTERASLLFDERTKMGALKDAAIKAMPDQPLDITSAYKDLVSTLEDRGIKIKDNGVLDFRRSTLSGSEDSGMKSLIENLVKDLRPNGAGQVLRTPLRIDEIRQKLFALLDLGKKQGTLTDAATALLENVRKTLKAPLDELSTKMGLNYTQAAEAYAKYSESIGEFTKLLGYKGSINDITKQSLRAGEILNRILGNASARPNEVLQKLIDLTDALGYKGGNPLDQVQFADILENIFGTTQTRGLKGEVNKAVGDAIEGTGIVKNLATGNISGTISSIGKKLFGVEKEKQIKALKDFLEMLKGEGTTSLEDVPVPTDLT